MTAGYDTKALLFDVFGTVVDWRSGIARELKAWGDERGIVADWPKVADAWRGLYQPAMERVRSGNRGFVRLDLLHEENLHEVCHQFGLGAGYAKRQLGGVTDATFPAEMSVITVETAFQ